MICLPVRFGDKSKFKSLEVNFLVVDALMVYNAIIGRPTLHRVKAVVARTMKRREHYFIKRNGGYTSSSPPSSRSSSLDAPASASKGLIASSSAASPLDEGGINSTSLGSRPSAASKYRSFENSPARLARPCRDRRGCPSNLTDSPAPWPGLHQPQPSPTSAAAPSFRFRDPLDLPAASHSVSDIER
ncbi:hypothetical protein Cgig2_025883 [Carnegiea gigantea]|uniref:Uncharacterized protein n=1 Tax=Carnegiea gigantea TaxID=171969 RepID=A0A9Q1K4C3_9CARY|nr:hypothetical protein Cgig2_025883 [Carnegiea gigantea]